MYLGIDLSYHNSTVNFSQLKNQESNMSSCGQDMDRTTSTRHSNAMRRHVSIMVSHSVRIGLDIR